MAGSIAEFKSSFTKDLARPNKFDVVINTPLVLTQYIGDVKNLTYRCENAQLPGRTFATMEQKIGSNPIEKYPYLTTYNDIDLTFIVDSDMNQKEFFDAWLSFINPQYSNNFRYKSDYVTDITITQYDVTNDSTYSVNLAEAFPISINQLDLDWSNDGYHKLTVTFAYTYWKNNSLKALALEALDSAVGGLTDKYGGLGGTLGGSVNSSLGGVISGIGTSIGAAPIIGAGRGVNNPPTV